MSNTNAVLEPQRLAYRPEIVDLIQQVTEPQIMQAVTEITGMQEKVNALQTQIADKKRFIAELRQAQRDIEACADLPLSLPLQGQGDPVKHAEVWGGPQTGVILPKGSFPETEPDGYCIHCGKAAWLVSTTTASPKGARHSYGATCDPENPASNVAELAVES
ncbi:hypothetical protein [Nonomuraea basaltis]|uniref:hypothetical protein n=1 Tax=Nonomuraea basaltis TaxID=2495887 RepID=UPI00110C601E|nr:hypothetical protein [Nonomuraea basaltis]TMS00123.1 hypothetical protein EJK15_03365 [Nonomuraea basaltis]